MAVGYESPLPGLSLDPWVEGHLSLTLLGPFKQFVNQLCLAYTPVLAQSKWGRYHIRHTVIFFYFYQKEIKKFKEDINKNIH